MNKGPRYPRPLPPFQLSWVKDPRLYLKMLQSKNLFLQAVIWQQEMTFC